MMREITKLKCEKSLAEFIRAAWHIIEPGQKYVHGWHIDFICYHLEAITNGVKFEDETWYNRLLVNVPPGTMKSLIIGVFWPAWEWGPRNMPHMRYVCASHSQDLAIRDSLRMRRLVTSEWYQGFWGDRVILTKDQNAKGKFENMATGSRQACAFEGITGYRGDRVIIDDPHSVEDANSDAKRASATRLFKEAVLSRLNNPDQSAIIVIMQRLHEADLSGVILNEIGGYDHIMLPMRFDPERACTTMLGMTDQRAEEGELLFPQRFPEYVVDRDEQGMGPYATAGQNQQNPEPRGGGIIKDYWWKPWTLAEYPKMDYVVASLDSAYTEKSENDPSAISVWGVYSGGAPEGYLSTRMVDRYGRPMDGNRSFERPGLGSSPKAMMMYAWQDRLELHDLVEKTVEICRMMKVNVLLIENKATGLTVAQELRRLFANEDFAVQMYDPMSLDKTARLYSVQHLFSEGLVHAPSKQWAEMVIRQVASFPNGTHDDLVDTVSMSLRHIRNIGMLQRPQEIQSGLDNDSMHRGAEPPPLYGGI